MLVEGVPENEKASAECRRFCLDLYLLIFKFKFDVAQVKGYNKTQ